MDLVALGIFLLTFLLCSVLVFFISVYGTKEVSFEENLKATQTSSKKKANSHQSLEASKKKAKKAKAEDILPQASNTIKDELKLKPGANTTNTKKWSKKKKRATNTQPEEQAILETVHHVEKVEDVLQVPEESPALVEKPVAAIEEKPFETEVEPTEEPVVAVEEPNLVVEDEPKSSAEPTPKKAKKPTKSKIKIEEVEATPEIEEIIAQPQSEVVETVIPEEVRKATAKKSKPKNKSKSDEGHSQQQQDLYGLVMKSTLDDLEIQRVIDLLLTKQTGSNGGFQHDWVEASAEKSETKNLQRQLAEKDALLAEEMAKVKSILEKMNALRLELNSVKASAVQSQRYMSKLEAQRNQIEQCLNHETESNRSLVATLREQVQYHANRAQALQATLDNVQQQQLDPAIYTELENLRSLKMTLEADRNGLHGQLSQQQEEMAQLQQKLSKKASDLEDTRNSLKSAMDANQKMNEQLLVLEKKSSSENEHVEDLKHANADLEAKVKELTSMCMKQKTELTRLTEENERISDQLAAYVERPKTEGQESNGISGENGHKNSTNGQEDEEWHKKYLEISQQHELIVKEKDVIVQQLHSAVSLYKSQVAKLEVDLEDQRAKNNELRSKNWKTVEALNNVEQNYQKLLKNTDKPTTSDREKQGQVVLHEAEQSQKLFLQRLFPEVTAKVAKAKKHNDWLEEFATHLSASKTEEDQLNKLEGQINHYKTVLAETENMLNQLQASVESEESSWKSKLADKEATLEDLQRKFEAVEAKNAAMEASINSLNSVEEMESKLRELQEKLALEEADKNQLLNQLNQSSDTDEELSKLRKEMESESLIRGEMDGKMAKMSQLLATAQEALQQEKKTVEMLRQQLATSPSAAKATSAASGLVATTNGSGQDEAAVVE